MSAFGLQHSGEVAGISNTATLALFHFFLSFSDKSSSTQVRLFSKAQAALHVQNLKVFD